MTDRERIEQVATEKGWDRFGNNPTLRPIYQGPGMLIHVVYDENGNLIGASRVISQDFVPDPDDVINYMVGNPKRR